MFITLDSSSALAKINVFFFGQNSLSLSSSLSLLALAEYNVDGYSHNDEGLRNKNGTTKMSNMNYIPVRKSQRELNTKTVYVRLKYRHADTGWLAGRRSTELMCAKMHQQIIYYAKHRGFFYIFRFVCPIRSLALSRVSLSQFLDFQNTCTSVYRSMHANPDGRTHHKNYQLTHTYTHTLTQTKSSKTIL